MSLASPFDLPDKGEVAAMLCSTCQALDLYRLVTALADCTVTEAVHHSSWKSVVSAVKAGCQLCVLIREAVTLAYIETYGWTRDKIESHHRQRDEEDETHFVVSSSDSGLGIIIDRRLRDLQALSDLELERATKYPDGVFARPFLRITSFDSNALGIPSRPVTSNVRFDICQQWLRECSDKHVKCSRIAEQDLPTRLIDVGPTDGSRDPKLVITKGQIGQYVTLSHCWGDSHPPVTDATSFHRYLECIPFATLPRTFRDAIVAVRRLGYQYLWIDCFCIIQGDQTDWESTSNDAQNVVWHHSLDSLQVAFCSLWAHHQSDFIPHRQIECARMHDTFAKSALTVAGPGAANTEAGFLHNRPSPTIPPCELAVKCKHETTTHCVGLELVDSGACSVYGHARVQQESALSSRAWIVQERYLSPRTLYFGSSQMYMECETTQVFEISRKAQDTVFDPDCYLRREIIFDAGVDKTLKTWYNIIEVYSKKKLTNARDRLPALSGLASRVRQTSKDTYLAGLWRSDLWAGLHWHRTDDDKGSGSNSEVSAVLQPPSWSWAACGLSVGFYPDSGSSVTREAMKIIDANVHVPGQDPFGEVAGGRLIISGRVKRATVFARPKDRPEDFWIRHIGKAGTHFYIVDSSGNGEEIAGLFPDDSSGEAIPSPGSREFQEIWCLLMGFHKIIPKDDGEGVYILSQQHFWTALALVPVDGSARTFRRVGLLVSGELSEVSVVPGYEEAQSSHCATWIAEWFDDAQDERLEIL